MKKIVFLNRYFYPDHSATSQILTDLAFGLAKRGVDIHVICSRQRYDDPKAQLSARESACGVMIHRIWTTRFGRHHLLGRAIDYFTFYISATAFLLASIDKDTIVVAKTDPPLISVIAAAVVRSRSARLVNWVQDLFPEVAAALGLKVARGSLYRMLKMLRNRSLRAADMNVVLGDLMSQYLEMERIPPGKITIISNWADGSQIKSIKRQDNPLRESWGLKGKFVVGYSGNLGRAHDFSTILAAAHLLERDSRIAFIFIGGGAQHHNVQQSSAALGLSNIHFEPYQPRNQLSLSLCVPDVHLISLRPALEGLIVPSKFYGIAAAGRPTIFVGDLHGEIAKLLSHWKCGLSIREGDAQGLAAAITELSLNVEKYELMSTNARETFLQEFNYPIAMEKWVNLLQQEINA